MPCLFATITLFLVPLLITVGGFVVGRWGGVSVLGRIDSVNTDVDTAENHISNEETAFFTPERTRCLRTSAMSCCGLCPGLVLECRVRRRELISGEPLVCIWSTHLCHIVLHRSGCPFSYMAVVHSHRGYILSFE